jgi:hypothetical protein
MANANKIHAKDARVITENVIKPIYPMSKVRTIFPIIQDLKAESLQVRYYTEEDDIPYHVGQEVGYNLGHVGYNYTDKDTVVLNGNLHYGFDEMQRIQSSSIPVDGRLLAVRNKIIEGEQRIGLYGVTVALDKVKAQTSVDDTTNNTTAWTTTFNVTTHALAISTFESAVGQLIDGLEELKDPLALVVNPDVYKLLRGLTNANTDLRTIDELNARMREIHPASPGVIQSKFLTCTIADDGGLRHTVTAGTSNACLFNINPQYYRIHTSPMFTRTDGLSSLNGQHFIVGERFTPVYIKKEAIIYEDAVTIA